MHDRNFGMFRGQRSTLGNGLSGEPLSAACHYFALPTTWRSTTAQGSRMRYSQCENAPLVLSSLYLPAGQFNHHKAKSGALQGWEDQRCSPDNRLRPFRIRVHPMSNSMVLRIADSYMGNWQPDFSQHAFLLPCKCADKSETAKFSCAFQGFQTQSLNSAYGPFCLTSTLLCLKSLSTFYCRFHCRPLNRFGLSVSHQTRKLWHLCVEHKQTRMKCTVGSKYGLWCESPTFRSIMETVKSLDCSWEDVSKVIPALLFTLLFPAILVPSLHKSID